jgi:hypothetical protein
MENLQNISANELNEAIQALTSATILLECDYLHVEHLFSSEIKTLHNRLELLINERNRREDLF